MSNSNIDKKVSNSNIDIDSLRNEVVTYALKFEGNPYVWGGISLTKGADCSGFAQSVFRDKGISIPRTSRAQAASGKIVSLSNLKPGDLVFYRKNGIINHVAIYIGEGKVISASSPSAGIKVSDYKYRKPFKAASYFDL
jgi:cell wall-associated NlpC family hydrolase